MAEYKELQQMLNWIKTQMQPDKWYPVKSDKAYDTIVELFNLNLIDDCEGNTSETHIRKCSAIFEDFSNVQEPSPKGRNKRTATSDGLSP